MAASVLQTLLSEIQNHIPALSVYVKPSESARDCGWGSDKTAEHALLEQRAKAISDLATTLGVYFTVETVPKVEVLQDVSIALQAQVTSFVDASVAISQALDLELQKTLLESSACVLNGVVVFAGYLLSILPSCGDEDDDGEVDDEDGDSNDDEDEDDVDVSALDESFGRLSGFDDELLLLDCDRQRIQREIENITELCELLADVCLSWKEMFQQKCKHVFDEMTECMQMVGGVELAVESAAAAAAAAGDSSFAVMSALQGCHSLVEKAVDICEFLMDIDFDVTEEDQSAAGGSSAADRVCQSLYNRLGELSKRVGEFCTFFAFIDAQSLKTVEETIPELAARGPDLVALFQDVVTDCEIPVVVCGDDDFGLNVLQESRCCLQRLLTSSL